MTFTQFLTVMGIVVVLAGSIVYSLHQRIDDVRTDMRSMQTDTNTRLGKIEERLGGIEQAVARLTVLIELGQSTGSTTAKPLAQPTD